MKFENLQNHKGYLGASIANAALWRPTPLVKLGKQGNTKVLLWKWPDEQIGSFVESAETDDFFTTARPVEQKVLRRGQRKSWSAPGPFAISRRCFTWPPAPVLRCGA